MTALDRMIVWNNWSSPEPAVRNTPPVDTASCSSLNTSKAGVHMADVRRRMLT
jgi:hypothetical protein